MKQLNLPDYKIGSSKHVDNYNKIKNILNISCMLQITFYTSNPNSSSLPLSNVIIRNFVGPYNLDFKCSGRTIFVAIMIKTE
jgi:hypothetical protein